MSLPRGFVRSLVAGTLLAGVLVPLPVRPAAASSLPTGFQEQVVFSGLTQPTNVEFAADGRVFVAQKNGVIKVFDSLADPTPDVFADLSATVSNESDRGLLGMALPPTFPADPYVYVLYTYDAAIGGTAPKYADACPDLGGGTCLVSGRLSRLRADGDHLAGAEEVLVNDWCQQFPGHSVGALHVGPDGALYVS